MATEKNEGQNPSKKRKPDEQAQQPSVPQGPDRTPKKKRKPDKRAKQRPLAPRPTRTPATNAMIQRFVKAHIAFERTFCKALQYAKEAGEELLRLQVDTGLKGAKLFAAIREHDDGEPEVVVSDRSCFLYLRIASRFNQLQIVAGDSLPEMSLSRAVKLLQETKAEKTDKPKGGKPKGGEPKSGEPKSGEPKSGEPKSGEPATESASGAAPSATPSGPVEEGTDAKPQEAQAGDAEKPIIVQPPFDIPDKDRLAAVFAENGPAPTPIVLMTTIVIPSLKRVADTGVSESDVPFLAHAIREALALIEMLKLKYAIS